ncbi:MAG TPA: hypothetical protein VII23_10435 [Terriglobales bacterium]
MSELSISGPIPAREYFLADAEVVRGNPPARNIPEKPGLFVGE